MSIFGEFEIPADEFTFQEAFRAKPELVVEIERVVAAEERLTPYFWVSNASPDAFEAAVRGDATVEQLERLDEFDEATLFRAVWTDRIDTLAYAYTHIGATILDAEGQNGEWMLRMRFDDREQLTEFNEYLNDGDIPFDLRRLYEVSQPRSGNQFGLTPKQTEALTTALANGYFDLPRTATTEEVADELDIAPQSLSDRLRRAEKTLLQEALRVDGPSDCGFTDAADS